MLTQPLTTFADFAQHFGDMTRARAVIESLPFTVPLDAIPGPYELQVFIWDPVTFKGGDVSTYLVRQVYPAVFRVG